MKGTELKTWRKQNGFTQSHLQRELGIKSRGTISAWENSEDPLPRTIELALIALERIPQVRLYAGKAADARERALMKEREATRTSTGT